MLGQKMFGFAMQLITVEKWEKQLQDLMMEMGAGEIGKDWLQPFNGPPVLYTCLQ
jgi:hypothetical protein